MHQQSLRSMFPEFEWSADADQFLENVRLNKTSVPDQLRERRIYEVGRYPGLLLLQLGKVGAALAEGERGFAVCFQLTLLRAECIISLGHEIGHTFHFDLHSWPPRNLYAGLDMFDKSNSQVKEIERFCEMFGERWVAQNSRDDILAIVSEFRTEFFDEA